MRPASLHRRSPLFFCAAVVLCFQLRVCAAGQLLGLASNSVQTRKVASIQAHDIPHFQPLAFSAFFLDRAAAERELSDANRRMYLAIPAILILYYAIFWAIAQRTFQRPPVTTQYSPPGEMSPAEMRYLITGDSDRQTVAAVVLHLASRGIVHIKPLDNFYLITKRVDVPSGLPPEEEAAFHAMFPSGSDPRLVRKFPFPLPGEDQLPKGSFVLHPVAGENFAWLAKAIYKSLRRYADRLYFARRLEFTLPATFLSIYLMVGSVRDFLPALLYTLAITTGVALINLLPGAKDLLRGRAPGVDPAWPVAGFILLLTLVVTADWQAAQSILFEFSIIGIFFLNLLAPLFLLAPTKLARERLGQIEGYRWFLNAVEVDKLHRLREEDDWKPSKATEHLAYAVALDMRNAWEDYLANSDFHSVVGSASKTKPPSPGVSAVLATSGGTGYGFVRNQVLVLCVVLAACFAIGVLKPSDFIAFWPTMIGLALVTIVVALWPIFRRESSKTASAVSRDIGRMAWRIGTAVIAGFSLAYLEHPRADVSLLWPTVGIVAVVIAWIFPPRFARRKQF